MKRIVLFLFAISLITNSFAQKRSAKYNAYIAKYNKIAVAQMKKHHIPASITLAQALLESGAGESRLATEAKNHFGIKCGRSWYGKRTFKDDDKKDECFRVYNKVEDSYLDHSKFLEQQRYSFLYDYKITDYKSWAKGLRQAGYATDPHYPKKLISIIETYKLYQFDNPANKLSKADIQHEKNQDFAPTDKLFGYIVVTNNGRQCIRLIQDDKLSNISKDQNISLEHLLKYNDMYKDMPLYRGDYIYLQPKKRQADKKHKTYRVKPGDSMHSIAQRFGIKLKYLYKWNEMEYGTPAKEYMTINLRKPRK